jgi:hypothetical protein
LTHRYGDGVQSLQAQIIGGALVFGALGILAKTFFGPKMTPAGPFVLRRRDRVAAVMIGALGGFVVGLTSVGSGTFFGLTMLVLFPLGAVKVVGTDVFHAAALLWVAGFGHFVAGNVDLRTVSWLLIGSIPGILIGSQLSVGIPERLLRTTLATVLMLSGIKLLNVPHGSTIIVAGLGVGAFLLAASMLHQYLARPTVPSASTPDLP